MRMSYSEAGVDIWKEDEVIRALSNELKFRRRGFGKPLEIKFHYAGFIDLGEFALAITSDGVGTKILVAKEMNKWDTIGIDCIAMNVNDLVAVGAEPLAFVDYLAMERMNEEIAREIARGLNRGAEIANISIVGGETATLPDLIRGVDLAGTCVGYVRKEDIITGERIKEGDVIIGVRSSGLHSNGYTLVRKLIERAGLSYHDPLPYDRSRTIGEELLTPTRIYTDLLPVIREHEIHGLVHITGGGFRKLMRVTELGYNIYDPLEPHPIFRFIQELGDIEEEEMYRTFNMGMGFAIILDEEDAKEVEKKVDGKIVGVIEGRGIDINGIRPFG
ncbi:MAG: phosphoribosylformylglycinamidine cyclo-ligase [Archaeoglobi archaeon]|nr:phosphoribosylformylglycinamidine cyclo-ligase [Archaeoglobi archaeon]MDK2781688.1 phosphoribosylformylglycinamidine cyclo-ligase [Archaeoglobi archaeon]